MRLITLLSTTLLASSACSSTAVDPQSYNGPGGKADDLSQGVIPLEIRATWSGNDAADEDDPSISFDDNEEQFSSAVIVALGPLEDCANAPADRGANTVCGWTSPSTLWSLDVVLSTRGIVSILASAGDLDTDGSTSLPLESIPQGSPWSFSFSPDNAGGMYGNINVQVQRLAPAEGTLGCEGLSFASVEGVEDEGEFDAYVECWFEDTLCWAGDKDRAASMLSDLFDLVWDGNRSLDDLNSEGESLLLYHSDYSGSEELLTVPACN